MTPLDTTRSLRRYQIVGLVSILAMGGMLGGWSALANIQGAVIAPAIVTVESFTKKVQHKEGGIVAAINVKDGDEVKAGQELVRLDDTDARAELGVLEALLTEFLAKRARLEAQRDGAGTVEWPPELIERRSAPDVARILTGQKKLFEARRSAIGGKKDQLNQQIGQLKEQIGGLASEQASRSAQIKLITGELESLLKLKKQGLVPASRILAMEREQARLEGELGSSVAAKAQADSKIGEIRIMMIQVDEQDRSEVLTDLRDAEQRIAELAERRFAAKSKLARAAIRAPIAGTVYQTMVHTLGGVVGPGEALMLIVPQGDTLVLQAQISPRDIDQVHVGQAAIVRFPALQSRTTPEIVAEVANVAADTSRASESQPPFYAVRLKLKPGEDKKLNGKPLKPGMPAEAFIQTDERTVLSYFLKPFADQIAHTFRES